MEDLEFSRRLADAIAADRENPRPPMFHEIMASGADEETAMIVARMLRKSGYYLVNPEHIGWPEINMFRQDIRQGQDYREDSGGFFARCISGLLGIRNPEYDDVVTHQFAAERLCQNIDVV